MSKYQCTVCGGEHEEGSVCGQVRREDAAPIERIPEPEKNENHFGFGCGYTTVLDTAEPFVQMNLVLSEEGSGISTDGNGQMVVTQMVNPFIALGVAEECIRAASRAMAESTFHYILLQDGITDPEQIRFHLDRYRRTWNKLFTSSEAG